MNENKSIRLGRMPMMGATTAIVQLPRIKLLQSVEYVEMR